MMKPDYDAIIQELIDFKHQIVVMDNKVRQYLSDRENHLHPFPEDLINEIRRYESKIHRLPNAEVQSRLDNLMYSLLVHEQIWKRLFEEDAKADGKGNAESTYQ
jgi:hypothetical protein